VGVAVEVLMGVWYALCTPRLQELQVDIKGGHRLLLEPMEPNCDAASYSCSPSLDPVRLWSEDEVCLPADWRRPLRPDKATGPLSVAGAAAAAGTPAMPPAPVAAWDAVEGGVGEAEGDPVGGHAAAAAAAAAA